METLSKEQIALTQLKDALHMYYSGNYISCITLAGAAEEIMARILDKSMKDMLGWSMKINYSDLNARLIADFIPYPQMHGMSEAQKISFKKKIVGKYFKNKNHPRNQLKHKRDNENFVKCNSFKAAAEEYINGAIYNYKMFKKGDYVPDALIEGYCKEKGLYIH